VHAHHRRAFAFVFNRATLDERQWHVGAARPPEGACPPSNSICSEAALPGKRRNAAVPA
jgi:hypothetical protein